MSPRLKSFAPALLAWYRRQRRDLPWRCPMGQTPDPYRVLLSEFMLQQTQVATVVPYFQAFLRQYPSMAALAAAEEQEVLRLWQGLGYYARARNLHAAAKLIVGKYSGQIPGSAAELLTLPGVGRYTAGAIASIAFGRREPILDGNVARVLCRLDNIAADPRERTTQAHLWRRAEEILPRSNVGDFNSALMELGATICTPRSPKCGVCPVREFCRALAAGTQEKIPPPKKSRPTPLIQRWTICIRHGNRWLIEQRPAKGRWARLWQFPTMEPKGDHPTAGMIRREVGLSVTKPTSLGTIAHALTHRRYTFDVFACESKTDRMISTDRTRRWVAISAMGQYPLSRAQIRIRQLLSQGGC
jgi:A/G-specific adenine glycosylase